LDKNMDTNVKSGFFEIGDRVEMAGLSRHVGVITAIKDSPYSGLTYSVKVGDNKRLDGINPMALTKL